MDNSFLISEAERIANELIVIQRSEKDLDTLFNEFLSKELKSKSLNILFYLTSILAQKSFYIETVSPFELKKNNF